MRTDVVFVHPGDQRRTYGELADEFTAIEPPTWSRMLAGWMRDRGYSVKIIDAEALGLLPDDVAGRIRGIQPRLVCIVVYGQQPSASSQQMASAGAIARAIKNRVISYTPILLVGAHVSALPERTMREEMVDAVCVGEGPLTIEGLLRGDDQAKIPGLVWREPLDPRKIHVNPSAPLIEDLSQLHGDVWDILPMSKYRAHLWHVFGDLAHRQPYASIYTTQGCPYACHFCMINAPFESRRYRVREPKAVVDQIEMLHRDYGVKAIKVADEMFLLRERHYMAICDGLIERGLGDQINLWVYGRVDSVKPSTLDRLRRAGIRWIALGIESGSQKVRAGANKVLKTGDDITSIVRAIEGSGINVISNFIFGLPSDDFQSMQETLDLAMSLRTAFANFYSSMAYPGSPMYAEAVARGAELPESWSGYSQHSFDAKPLATEHLTSEQILDFRDSAFMTYFTDAGYLAMLESRFGVETREVVEAMTRTVIRRRHREPVAAE
jgi:anaerobic magnesium-protoporphyrin IX monomethyl ester cyclase